jgi:type II secretory pathway component GspD/PulD (secretin)
MKCFSMSLVVITVLILSGCAQKNENKAPLSKRAQTINDTQEKMRRMMEGDNAKSYVLLEKPRVVPKAIPKQSLALEKLSKLKLDLLVGSKAISLKEVSRALEKQGLRISSRVNSDRYLYDGFSVRKTDALTLLEIISSTTNLDFEINETSSGEVYITWVPLIAESYKLNIGPRDNSLNMSASTGGNSSGSSQDSSSSGDSSATSSSTSNDSGSASNETGGSNNSSTASLSYVDSYWKTLKAELEALMIRPIPIMNDTRNGQQTQGVPNLSGNLPQPIMNNISQSGNEDMFREVKIGRVVVNESTGNVTVMAPKTIRNQIINYLKQEDAELNTMVVVRAQVLIVNDSDNKTQGIDWSAIGTNGSDEFLVSNDVFGNVTINTAEDVLSTIAQGAISNTFLGYRNADKTIQAFLANLNSLTNTKTLQMPVAQTTSGVPVTLSVTEEEYQILVSTSEGISEGGAVTGGATNNLVTFTFGTNIQLVPRYDPQRQFIRTRVNLDIQLKRGVDLQNQVINTRGDVQQIELPLRGSVSYQGEALIKPGQVVVLGGQRAQTIQKTDSGLTFLKDIPFLGAFFGSESETETESTYYLLLSAEAVPYGSI